jgi:hypothetical protein
MSDEYTVEERLAGVYRGLRWNSIFLCLGNLLGFVGLLGLGLFNYHPFLSPLIVAVIASFPALKAMLAGGFGAALTGPLQADYEVVTVDGSGNVIKSDDGTQSMINNFVMRLGGLVLILEIAPVVVFIHVIYLSVKGLNLTAQAKVKPPFKKSVGSLILLNIAVYIVSVVLMAGAAFVRMSVRDATIADISGQTLTVYTNTLNLRAELSGTSMVIKTLKMDDKVTATGDI